MGYETYIRDQQTDICGIEEWVAHGSFDSNYGGRAVAAQRHEAPASNEAQPGKLLMVRDLFP
jgi:hypothetical protein